MLHLGEPVSPPERTSHKVMRLFRLAGSLLFVLLCMGGVFWATSLLPLAQKSGPHQPQASYEANLQRFKAKKEMPLYQDPWPSAVVGRIQAGETAKVLRDEGSWLMVETQAGPGWLELRKPPVLASASKPSQTSITPTQSPPVTPAFLPASPAQALPTPTQMPLEERLAKNVEERRRQDLSRAWANTKLASSQLHKLETDHFILWTDVQDSATPGMLLGLAEQTKRRFEQWFERRFQLKSLVGKNEIYLFQRQYDYWAFYNTFSSKRAHQPAGHYSPDLRLIGLSKEVADGNALAAIFVHEMIHLLLDQMLYLEANTEPSPWLAEGLANFFAYTTGSNGLQIVGIETRQDPFQLKTAARARLRQYQSSIKNNHPLSLKLLLDAERADFDGAEASLFYDAAWLWCHFLAAKHPEILLDTIAADRKSQKPPDSLLALESEWRAFVKLLDKSN